jgi:protein involved in ribonucleotide reduction
MQINTMTQGGAPGAASDADRLQMQEMVQDFLNHQESQKKIRGIIGKTNRLTINMDELR